MEIRAEVAPEFLDLASCVVLINEAVLNDEEQSSFDLLNLGKLSEHHEREACAQVCYFRCPMDGTVSVEVELARAIRARGEA